MPPAAHAPFNLASRLQAMLDVEVALTEALAEAGVVPADSVAPVRAAAAIDRYDLDELVQAAAAAGNLAIPLVAALTRAVAATDARAAGTVHRGATSQDVIDTALVLEARAVVRGTLTHLAAAADAAASKAHFYEGNRRN